MDDVNSQLRKEYEMLRMEFEQNLVANEQTGPINREMRHLITSLQDHNVQLKSDVHRYKRKYKELSAELGRVSIRVPVPLLNLRSLVDEYNFLFRIRSCKKTRKFVTNPSRVRTPKIRRRRTNLFLKMIWQT